MPFGTCPCYNTLKACSILVRAQSPSRSCRSRLSASPILSSHRHHQSFLRGGFQPSNSLSCCTAFRVRTLSRVIRLRDHVLGLAWQVVQGIGKNHLSSRGRTTFESTMLVDGMGFSSLSDENAAPNLLEFSFPFSTYSLAEAPFRSPLVSSFCSTLVTMRYAAR